MPTSHAVANSSPWNIAYSRAVKNTVPWDMAYLRTVKHQLLYDMPLQAMCQSPYALTMQVKHYVAWEDLAQHAVQMTTPYDLVSDHFVAHSVGYELLVHDKLAVTHKAGYSLLSGQSKQAVINNPQLSWYGEVMGITQANLSCDESSPYWIADIQVGKVSDYSRIQVGDAVSLEVAVSNTTEVYQFIVVSKHLSRGASGADIGCSLSCSSPLCLLDTPFSGNVEYTNSGGVLASTLVSNLLGSVIWSLTDWIIPAGEATFTGVSPLRAAQRVVEAIGGLIESNPDGSFVCRQKHPVSVPDYYTATPVHSLFDSDVISSQGMVGLMAGFNSLTLSNTGNGTSTSDQLEQVPHPDFPEDGTLKRVRATLAYERPVALAFTGNPATSTVDVGQVTRSETEVVEFKDGVGHTRYPITRIVSYSWNANDLGVVNFSGSQLTSAVKSYSLLSVTYNVTTRDWDVGLDLTQEVQFLILDI